MSEQTVYMIMIRSNVFQSLFRLTCWCVCLLCSSGWSSAQHQAVVVVPPGPSAPRILIAYYSDTGHTQIMAEAVARGASSVPDVLIELKKIGDIQPSDVLAFDAIVLGTPVQNANPAPELLTFIRSWPFEGQPMKDKLGAVFTTGGGISAGEELVQMSLVHAMLVYGMVIVGGEEWTAAFGASAVTGEKPFTEKKIDPMFLRKAEALGKRVARSVRRWNPR